MATIVNGQPRLDLELLGALKRRFVEIRFMTFPYNDGCTWSSLADEENE